MTDDPPVTPPAARHLHGPSMLRRFSTGRQPRMSSSPIPAAEIAHGGDAASQSSTSSNTGASLEEQSGPQRTGEVAPTPAPSSRPSVRRRAVALLISVLVVASIPALLFALFFLI